MLSFTHHLESGIASHSTQRKKVSLTIVTVQATTLSAIASSARFCHSPPPCPPDAQTAGDRVAVAGRNRLNRLCHRSPEIEPQSRLRLHPPIHQFESVCASLSLLPRLRIRQLLPLPLPRVRAARHPRPAGLLSPRLGTSRRELLSARAIIPLTIHQNLHRPLRVVQPQGLRGRRRLLDSIWLSHEPALPGRRANLTLVLRVRLTQTQRSP